VHGAGPTLKEATVKPLEEQPYLQSSSYLLFLKPYCQPPCDSVRTTASGTYHSKERWS